MEQTEALEIMLSGQSVVLCGRGGAGKTHTLKQFIERNRLLGRKTAVTATTGLAASHLNGQTLHSWARVGLGKELPDDWQFTISKKKRKEFQTTATLVIDEVSMMPDFVFDMLDTVLRWARNDDRPFGGIPVSYTHL